MLQYLDLQHIQGLRLSNSRGTSEQILDFHLGSRILVHFSCLSLVGANNLRTCRRQLQRHLPKSLAARGPGEDSSLRVARQQDGSRVQRAGDRLLQGQLRQEELAADRSTAKQGPLEHTCGEQVRMKIPPNQQLCVNMGHVPGPR